MPNQLEDIKDWIQDHPAVIYVGVGGVALALLLRSRSQGSDVGPAQLILPSILSGSTGSSSSLTPPLQPPTTPPNNPCGAGFVYNATLRRCVRPSGVGDVEGSGNSVWGVPIPNVSRCPDGTHWSTERFSCVPDGGQMGNCGSTVCPPGYHCEDGSCIPDNGNRNQGPIQDPTITRSGSSGYRDVIEQHAPYKKSWLSAQREVSFT